MAVPYRRVAPMIRAQSPDTQMRGRGSFPPPSVRSSPSPVHLSTQSRLDELSKEALSLANPGTLNSPQRIEEMVGAALHLVDDLEGSGNRFTGQQSSAAKLLTRTAVDLMVNPSVTSKEHAVSAASLLVQAAVDAAMSGNGQNLLAAESPIAFHTPNGVHPRGSSPWLMEPPPSDQ